MNWLIQYLEVSGTYLPTYLPQLSVRLVSVYWFIKFYCTAKCILAYSSIIVAVSTDKCSVFPFISCASVIAPSQREKEQQKEWEMTTFLFTEDRNISQSLYIELWWLLVMELCSPFFPKIIGEVRFAAESFFMNMYTILNLCLAIYHSEDVYSKTKTFWQSVTIFFFFLTNPNASSVSGETSLYF